jgi:hypothetical protein
MDKRKDVWMQKLVKECINVESWKALVEKQRRRYKMEQERGEKKAQWMRKMLTLGL